MTDGREITRISMEALEPYHDFPLSPELLQQCIALERRRNFRVLCWISTTFLLVILAVTAILLSIGLALLKDSQSARTLAENTATQTRLELDEHKLRMEGVSSEARTAGEKVANVSASLQEEKVRYGRDREILLRDLIGFSRWNELKYLAVTGTLSTVAELTSRLAELEMADKARMERFASIEKWYRENKARIDRLDAGTGAGSPASAAGTVANASVASAGTVGIKVETRTYQNGDRYTGGFLGGMRHGRGTYVHRSGDRYEGEFLNGKREGQGIYSYANGDVYVGAFRGDKKNGEGTYSYADGTKVSGVWQSDTLLP